MLRALRRALLRALIRTLLRALLRALRRDAVETRTGRVYIAMCRVKFYVPLVLVCTVLIGILPGPKPVI